MAIILTGTQRLTSTLFPAVANNSPISMGGWVYIRQITVAGNDTYMCVEGNGVVSGTGAYLLRLQSVGVADFSFLHRAVAAGTQCHVMSAANALTLGWNHIAVCYDGSFTSAGGTTYVNGQPLVNGGSSTNGSGTAATANNNFAIGARFAGTEEVTGSIYRPFCCNVKLSAAQVLALYNAPGSTIASVLTPIGVSEANILAAPPLDTDASDPNLTLSATGSPTYVSIRRPIRLAGSVARYDARDAATSSDRVTGITDSLAGNNAAAIAATRPGYLNDLTRGVSVAFDPSSSAMTSPTGAATAMNVASGVRFPGGTAADTSSFTVIAVMGATTPAGTGGAGGTAYNQRILTMKATTTDLMRLVVMAGGDVGYGDNATTELASATSCKASSSPGIHVWRGNTTTQVKTRRDALTDRTLARTAGVTGATEWRLGADAAATPGSGFLGHIQTLVMWNVSLSDAEVDAEIAAMAADWNVNTTPTHVIGVEGSSSPSGNLSTLARSHAWRVSLNRAKWFNMARGGDDLSGGGATSAPNSAQYGPLDAIVGEFASTVRCDLITQLSSNDLSNYGHNAWSAGTTYSGKGTFNTGLRWVQYPTNGAASSDPVYLSITNGNLANIPSSSPANWTAYTEDDFANWLFNGLLDGAETGVGFIAYCTARVAAGWDYVWSLSILDRSTGANVGETLHFDGRRLKWNTLLAQYSGTVYRIINTHQNSIIGGNTANANGTYFADVTHLNDAGQAVVDSYINQALGSGNQVRLWAGAIPL